MRAIALTLLISLPCAPAAQRSPIRFELGPAKLVYGSGQGTGQLFALADGSLYLAGIDFSIRTTDSGNTWFTQPGIRGMMVQRRDGSFYVLNGATDYYVSEGRTKPSDTPGRFLSEWFTLKHWRELLRPERPDWQSGSFTVTQVAAFTDDTGSMVATPFMAGPFVELSNGDLLVATYGKFEGDTVPIPGLTPTKGERWFKSRTYILLSKDGGKNWTYLSTVAYDGDTGQESFVEPAMLNLGNDELLAVMRTGRFAPLHATRSKDGGRTWGKPRSLKTLGLSPQMTTLPDGTVVLSFGWRPFRDDPYYRGALEDYNRRYRSEIKLDDPSAGAGDYVMVSVDKGHTWSAPQKFAEPLTVGYTRVAPVGADSVLVMSQRFKIPGMSDAAVLDKWKHNWAEAHKSGAKRIFEARLVTIRR